MPWYGWLILGFGVVLALVLLALRVVRASARGRGFMSLSTRGKIEFGRSLLRDEHVPITAKVSLIILVGYLALPFDLIPDFVPVVGQLDDFLVVMAAISLLILAIPREQFEAALRRTRAEEEARRAREAAAAEPLVPRLPAARRPRTR